MAYPFHEGQEKPNADAVFGHFQYVLRNNLGIHNVECKKEYYDKDHSDVYYNYIEINDLRDLNIDGLHKEYGDFDEIRFYGYIEPQQAKIVFYNTKTRSETKSVSFTHIESRGFFYFIFCLHAKNTESIHEKEDKPVRESVKIYSEPLKKIQSSDIFEIFSSFLKSVYDIMTIEHEEIHEKGDKSKYEIIVKMKDLPNLKINNYGEFDQIRFYSFERGKAHAAWAIEKDSPARISFDKVKDDSDIHPVFFHEFANLSQVRMFIHSLRGDIVYSSPDDKKTDENTLMEKLKKIDSMLKVIFDSITEPSPGTSTKMSGNYDLLLILRHILTKAMEISSKLQPK